MNEMIKSVHKSKTESYVLILTANVVLLIARPSRAQVRQRNERKYHDERGG